MSDNFPRDCCIARPDPDFFERKHPVRSVISILRHSVHRIGDFPEPATGVVLVVDRAPAVVFGLGDSIAGVVGETQRAPAGQGGDTQNIAQLSVSPRDADLIAVAVSHALYRRILAEYVNSPVLEREVPTALVPVNSRPIKRRTLGRFENRVRPTAAG